MSNQTTKFNEMTRVQMPALVHLTRIGYEYFGKLSEDMANTEYDKDTNILLNVFKESFERLNPDHKGSFAEVLQDIRQELDTDDLGKKFYERLSKVSPIKLIDFENIENNSFYCTAEFTCKRDQEEFRPDITLFVNGLPLVFIEVKRPDNTRGILAEKDRIETRFQNKKFRRFLNITQFMIFSNNREYDTLGGTVPIQGAFYSTISRYKAILNCFREESDAFIKNYPYKEKDSNIEKKILSDYNNQVIFRSPEYNTNLNSNSPTNRIITSMCSPQRLLYLLKYGLVYVKDEREIDGVLQSREEKHIMRYQQLFASLALTQKLDEGIKSGVIWHTQGSGKTALSYSLTYILSDYYAKQNTVTKFYFIVDRLDLLEQASQEFTARGLVVKTADSRQELMADFRENKSQEGNSGKAEIVVVNIHKFAEDKEKIDLSDYATNLQRVFIIDEAHRGYNPKGSFLANLLEADKNAIKIALTGTPLLKEERASWQVFGNYIHTYYYDKSIQDGYTLKIIREDIETSYKDKLLEIYEGLETLIEKKDIKKAQIIEHDNYVKELLRYIITDIKKFRALQGDSTLGGMFICETSEQARKLHTYFDEIQKELNENASIQSNLKVGLILHDSEDKEIRKQIIKDFKKNMTVDLLIVFNMLLTGFDAPRLKRLYFGRKLKDHNLLQALTRVNRPYKENKYGYIIDFANIKHNFDQTNKAYLEELGRFTDQEETGLSNITNTLSQVLEDKETLLAKMKEVKQVLFNYTTDNAEEFSLEIANIEDKEELLKLKKVLTEAKDAYNIVRTFGDDDLKEAFNKMELSKVPLMISEVQRHIDIINQKELFSQSDETKILINEAMQNISFSFNKIAEEELRLIDDGADLKQKWDKVIQSFTRNIDPEDPEYISLHEAFMLKFKERGFVIDNLAMYEEYSKDIDDILKRLADLHKINNNLMKKYNDDAKYVRVHKRLKEENTARKAKDTKPIISEYDEDILSALSKIKEVVDQKIYDRSDILKNESYFEQAVMEQLTAELKILAPQNNREDRLFLKERIAKQYLDQYN